MNTNWSATTFDQDLVKDDYKLAVPLTLLYLTHPAVAFIGKYLDSVCCYRLFVALSHVINIIRLILSTD